ncbi:MAG: hypothetical protein H8E45_02025 [Proteobacteria bacterium]|nr:hypothetical protein [Pseudomonadota bacterium]
MKTALLALDAGTTQVKAIAYNEKAAVLARAVRPVTTTYPGPGLVEQDASQVLTAAVEVLTEVLGRTGGKAKGVKALGLANQRGSIVAWDSVSTKPLSPMISWQDTRGAERCEQLQAAGFFVMPGMAASKAEWIMANIEAAAGAAAAGRLRMGTPNSWLVAGLCGGLHTCDHSNAFPSGLYDFADGDWSDALLVELGLERAMLPGLVDSKLVTGGLQAEFLGAPVPLGCTSADQQASLFGLGCLGEGSAKCTLGTSASVNLNTGGELRLGGPGTFPLVAWREDGVSTYCMEGQVITAGEALRWVAATLGFDGGPAALVAQAETADDCGGAWMIPALHGLGTPWQENNAQAQLGGLSAVVGRAQLARATLEGVAHRVVDAAEGLWQTPGEALSNEPLALEALRVDGGASSSELLLQMIADFTGTRVERSSDPDGGARGVALMAAAAVGLDPCEGDPGGGWSFDRVFEPTLTEERRLEQRATWKARVQSLVEVSG